VPVLLTNKPLSNFVEATITWVRRDLANNQRGFSRSDTKRRSLDRDIPRKGINLEQTQPSEAAFFPFARSRRTHPLNGVGTQRERFMVSDVMVWNENRNVQTQRNWLSRFTRGLGSFLTAFGTTRGSESSSTLSSLPEEPQQLSSPHKTSMPHSVWPDNSEAPLSVDGSNGSRVKDVPRVLQTPQTGSLMEQSRQRLAGHTTKIRLEAPPVPETPSPMVRQNISETPRETLDVSPLSSFPVAPGKTEGDIRFPMTSPQVTNEKAQPSHPLTRNGTNKAGAGTQRHLLTGHMSKGNIGIVTRNPLYGSGEFGCGQCDVVVKNPAVRASSVILVTLTSNPGPVVVHYVSLLPYEGFTVHLTAPTTMQASFNYTILPSELT